MTWYNTTPQTPGQIAAHLKKFEKLELYSCGAPGREVWPVSKNNQRRTEQVSHLKALGLIEDNPNYDGRNGTIGDNTKAYLLTPFGWRVHWHIVAFAENLIKQLHERNVQEWMDYGMWDDLHNPYNPESVRRKNLGMR